MELKFLKFDSDLFGYNVYSVHVAGLADSTVIKVVLSEARKVKASVVYLFTEEKLPDKHDEYLMDTKVTFKRLIVEADTSFDNKIKEYSSKNLDNRLLKLAVSAGVYSRFKIDKNFKRNEYEKLYKIWIEKSVSGEVANKIFVYIENDGSLVGFITVKLNPGGIGSIGLIAVDKNFRGKGIGAKLINRSLEYFFDNKCDTVTVATQLNNIPACKLYQKTGFTISEKIYCYHLWPEKIKELS
jgi:dTDP-4-amino-4,6-dideoxy-D-galactose acyltransferase